MMYNRQQKLRDGFLFKPSYGFSVASNFNAPIVRGIIQDIYPVPAWSNKFIGPAMEQSEWLNLVIGPQDT